MGETGVSRVSSGTVSHVLITGGRGQLGGELQRLLQRAGVPYEALDLPELDVTDERAVRAAVQRVAERAEKQRAAETAVQVSWRAAERASGRSAGGSGGTALVIHAAAFTAVDRAEDPAQRELATRVNAEGTRNVARACAAAGLPLVYVSTDFVFGGEKRVPYEVDDEPAPLSVYGATKLAGEQAVREIWPQHYIVRTAWVYGVYGRNFPGAILGAAAAAGAAPDDAAVARASAEADDAVAAAGAQAAAKAAKASAQATSRSPQPLRVVDDQVGCPTYAHDLAEAILLLAGVPVVQPEGVQLLPQAAPAAASPRAGAPEGAVVLTPAPFGTYHVTNGGSCSWYEFAREIVGLAGWPVEVEPISSAELNRPARRPAYSVLSPAKLRSVGLQLRPWQEALRAFMAELRADSPDLFLPASRND